VKSIEAGAAGPINFFRAEAQFFSKAMAVHDKARRGTKSNI
jgi:hypothetical protein